MEKLCRTYWYPLYAYVRREGYSAADAQDLTQEFFARLLAKNYLAQVGPQKGKFRSFLLAALRHFLSDQRDRARAVKRGGGAELPFPGRAGSRGALSPRTGGPHGRRRRSTSAAGR